MTGGDLGPARSGGRAFDVPTALSSSTGPRGPATTVPTGGRDMTRVIGYAPGAYDLFHIGHLNLLRHARAQCDHLIAGVVSDEMLLRTKGRAPVVPLAERMEIVRSLRIVDEVHAEVVPDKLDTWREVRFDVIFKGDDWRGTPKGDRLERDFAGVGVEVRYFPYTVHTSSTALRKALARLEQTPLAATADGH
jgi:glycerol-3-phosphate cytidylyltransferase